MARHHRRHFAKHGIPPVKQGGDEVRRKRESPIKRVAIIPASIGGAWPFIPSGVILCGMNGALWVEYHSKQYALNGLATQLLGNKADDLHDIWRDDTSVPGTKVDLSDVLKWGAEQFQ